MIRFSAVTVVRALAFALCLSLVAETSKADTIVINETTFGESCECGSIADSTATGTRQDGGIPIKFDALDGGVPTYFESDNTRPVAGVIDSERMRLFTQDVTAKPLFPELMIGTSRSVTHGIGIPSIELFAKVSEPAGLFVPHPNNESGVFVAMLMDENPTRVDGSQPTPALNGSFVNQNRSIFRRLPRK